MADPKDPKDAGEAPAEQAPVAEDNGSDAEDELSKLPGRPIGPDEIDPELMKLSKARTRIGWLLSLSIVSLCGYVMLQMRADLSFSREADKPRIVESATALTEAQTDSFVAVRAVPDRAYAARVLKSKASMGQRLYPVFGTDDKVWLLISGSPWDDRAVYSEVWAGRVRRIADLPFAESLREYLEQSPPRPRFLPPALLQKALADKASSVAHPSGDTLAVTATTPVVVSERMPGVARITVTRSDSYADEDQWRSVLARAGVMSAETQPESGDGESWTYQVQLDTGEVATRLSAARLIAEIQPVHRDHPASWGDLSASDGGLRVGETSVPWHDVTRISLSVKRNLPAGATVLVASEHPGDYWFMLPLFGILAAFALLFGWALSRAVRGDQPAAESSSGATA